MTAFLEKTAHYLLEHYPLDRSEICVVLPNRRAGLFLRKYLASELSGPVWSPVIFSIEDFLATLSGLRESDGIFLLMELYDVHKSTEKDKAQTFDEFLNWGPQLLADFNEIDRYLADAKDLFAYLDEARAINLWNLDKTPLTEFQLIYLKFYQSLYHYYDCFKNRLIAKGEGYQGLVFRYAWDRLAAGKGKSSWQKIIFAGFNALTTAEERVMQYFQQEGKADFLWDADHYYLDQKQHEAGDFLRRWFSQWPLKEKFWIGEDFLHERKNIEIIGVPDVAGQVKLCGELLQEMPDLPDERTAIVLPDEKLLLPLLNSLPGKIEDLNVTMGLPLKHTPLADLLDTVIQMHLNTQGMSQAKNGSDRFYYRDVLKVLRHPFLSRISGTALKGNTFAMEDLCQRVRSGSQIFLSLSDLRDNGLFDEGFDFLNPFFLPWKESRDAFRDLRKIVELIIIEISGKTGFLAEKEYCFMFARIIRQLETVFLSYPSYFSWNAFYRFFRQLAESTAMPFFGEPLRGIQLMGMLETRTLDFDQIIILSCNEGLLPSGKQVHSFIPFDIRKEFGLPTYKQQDSIYAYHFYRMLQRAGKVWLLYSTESDQLGGGEKSRYLQQISQELPAFNPGILIRESILGSPFLKGTTISSIRIPKEGNIPEILKRKAVDGFSPTALNTFRACPLRFYFSEVAGLREPDDFNDEIDAKTLGNTVHQVLFQFYKPLKKMVVTVPDLESMIDKVDVTVKENLQKKFRGTALNYGKNLLLVNVACIMIKNFLKSEIRQLEELAKSGLFLTITMLEQRLRRSILIQSGGENIQVLIQGVADRIDHIGNETRILDYKTGMVEKKELLMKDWNELLEDPRLDKSFQLITYAWMLAEFPNTLPLLTGIIPMKKPANGVMAVQVQHNQLQKPEELLGESDLAAFESVLKELLSGIFDFKVPFCQTSSTDHCAFCPYTVICGR